MEISSANYNCSFPDHLGMDDSNIFDDEYYQFHFQFQSEMDSFMGYPVAVEEVELQPSLSGSGSGDSYSSYNNNNNCLSPESVICPRPTKQLKTSVTQTHLMPNYNAASTSSSSQIISFHNNSNSNSSSLVNNVHSTISDNKRKPKIEMNDDISHHLHNENLHFSSFFTHDHKTMFKYDIPTTKAKTPAVARNPVQAQDHVMAERKRREKLTQRFIALSAILPGLKKMDKASVLGAAIKHVENLQERVKTLEEQVTKKTVESAVFVNRSLLCADDGVATSSSNGNSDQPLPEIEARVSGEDVLIRIQCDKHVACVPAVLGELQNLHLTVQSSSFLPFGTTIIHITIVAQMDKEYCMTAKELVRSLRQALTQIVDSE